MIHSLKSILPANHHIYSKFATVVVFFGYTYYKASNTTNRYFRDTYIFKGPLRSEKCAIVANGAFLAITASLNTALKDIRT